jgi:protein kinase C substrate 80K-H
MKYEHGASCWSGPQRSTTVFLVCDSEDKIIDVSEPETCTYEMTVGTPAVCTEMDMPQLFAGGGAKPTKEEL